MAKQKKDRVQKANEGTLRDDRDNVIQMTFERPESVPLPPETLNEVGQKEWRRVCDHLHKEHRLAVVDYKIIEMYCTCIEIYEFCMSKIRTNTNELDILQTTPNGYKARGGYFTEAMAAQKRAVEIGMLFGITPRGRAQIPNANQPQQGDLFEEMRNKMLNQ
jgi:P27 family predicted phage terminase small subunit